MAIIKYEDRLNINEIVPLLGEPTIQLILTRKHVNDFVCLINYDNNSRFYNYSLIDRLFYSCDTKW